MIESNENLEDFENENLETQNLENQENYEEPEILEPEPQPNPWDNAPSNVYFYEKVYEDGHLGSHTQSAELAYKSGWSLDNYISIEDTEKSEINGWIYKKELCPHKTEEEIQQEAVNQRIVEIQVAVQNLLDSKAKEKLYDDAFAICSYANSTDETFHSEANQFIAWRDHCWRKCYEILALFQNGDIPMPTVNEVLRQLPTLDWE